MSSNARWLRDLVAVVGLTVLGGVVVLFDVGSSPYRTVLVAPLVLFAPGYAIVAALYPERYRPRDDPPTNANRIVASPTSSGSGLPPSARAGLSVAASVAVLPAVALVVGFAAPTLQARPILVVLVGLTLLSVGVAVARRRSVPVDDRVSAPSLRELVRAAGQYVSVHSPSYTPTTADRPTSRRGVALNVALVVAVAVFVASVGIAFAVPTTESGFTELYLLTEADDGSFVAGDYPRRFDGDAEPLYVAIENHEGGPRTYTVVVELQRVDRTPNGTTVVEERRVDRFSRQVGGGETVRVEHRPTVTASGADYRLRYLLYVGEPPADPSADTAYRSVHLWLGGGGENGTGSANRTVGTVGAGGDSSGGTA